MGPMTSTPSTGSGAEQPAPYGTRSAAQAAEPLARIRTHHLQQMTDRGEKWAMLTAYDQYIAEIFDQAGIPCLLVGDSAANNVYGYESSLPITVEEMLVLSRAVTRAAKRALVVGDLPFGSYQDGPSQAMATAIRFMKEARVHAVKLEGGAPVAPTIRHLVDGGIPVMAHIGFTPQSEHALGGYRVQGRGGAAGKVLEDALAVQEAGAFAVVMEMVPAPVAAEVSEKLEIPTVGIGAGNGCDAQVLVWQDMAGLRGGKAPRFVKKYLDLRSQLSQAARDYAAEVASGEFPAAEHSFLE